MAKQTGDITISGTIDGVTFYRMEGRYYARRKSSLTGRRVKTDPRFKRTMASAGRMARGAPLASSVYRRLPKTERVQGLYRELVSIAVLALKEGKDEGEVKRLLEQRVMKERSRMLAGDGKAACRSTIRIRSVFCKKLIGLPGRRSGSDISVQETPTRTRRSEPGLPVQVMLVLRE